MVPGKTTELAYYPIEVDVSNYLGQHNVCDGALLPLGGGRAATWVP